MFINDPVRCQCSSLIDQSVILGTWTALGVSPTVIGILKKATPCPSRTDQLRIISGYVYALRNSYLIGALPPLMQKNAVEPVRTKKSLGFFNRIFLVQKPNMWRSILDLSTLNKFLNIEKFKVKTQETMRTYLQPIGSG